MERLRSRDFALIAIAAHHARRRLPRALAGLRLARAIRREELYLCFQPIIELVTGKAYALEALVRWAHPKRGLVMPAEFVDEVEAGPFAHALDTYVLEAAVRQAKALAAAGTPVPISVNLSVRSLDDPDFAERLVTLVAQHRLPARLVAIEVTERALEATPNAAAVVERLSAHGIGVALDDFGVGYSALQRLIRLPLASLKIDRSFVAEMERNERAAVVVHSAVELTHALGMTIVAEGIESEGMAHWLRELGVDCAQGYLVAKPMGVDELGGWLRGTRIRFSDRRRRERRQAEEIRGESKERRSWSDRRTRRLHAYYGALAPS